MFNKVIFKKNYMKIHSIYTGQQNMIMRYNDPFHHLRLFLKYLAAKYATLEMMILETFIAWLIGRCGSNISRITTNREKLSRRKQTNIDKFNLDGSLLSRLYCKAQSW